MRISIWFAYFALIVWEAIVAPGSIRAREHEPQPAHVQDRGFLDAVPRWLSPQVRRLESFQLTRQHRLATLPEFVPQVSFPAGFHTAIFTSSSEPQWVQVDLGRQYDIDAIVLVPVVLSHHRYKQHSYGFPKRFRVEVSNDGEENNFKVVDDFTTSDMPDPGVFPVSLPQPATRGRYVRVTCIKLDKRDELEFFALGELIVLAENRNVALWRPVTASSQIDVDLRWSPIYLVDELCILPPPFGTKPSRSDGYLSGRQAAEKWIELDLGRVCEIDEVRLFPARPALRAHVPGWGLPLSFKIELSRDRGFSDPVVLVDYSDRELRHWSDRPLIFPVGSRQYFTKKGHDLDSPAINMPADSVPAQYLRLTVNQLDNQTEPRVLALAELQVYSGSSNVAHGAAVSTADAATSEAGSRWDPTFLVDGFTSRSNIVENNEWLWAFKERQILEQRLANDELKLAAARTQIWTWTGATSGFAFVVTIGTLVVANSRQRRRTRLQTEQLRERIASDLHDDIGSNLGTIALIAQTLQENSDLPGPVQDDLKEIHEIAKETSDSMRDIIWVLRADEIGLQELIAHLRIMAVRLLPNCDVSFECSGPVPAVSVGLDWRRDILYSFKETLHNVARHSHAEHVAITLASNDRWFNVKITDDGSGFDPQKSEVGHGIDHLQQRLSRLGGTFDIESGSGTTVRMAAPFA